ncbi:LAFA_0E12112g1_1 [Lachancea sp. 'fantastica']|nr:LAFA_0E12112g1_1 [Lachancea sp. 'fantastica']
MNYSELFPTANAKYNAVRERNVSAEGIFVYAVKTTGVVCRPTCSARLALFKHVVFFENTQQAVTAGFRPCLRCKPEIQLHWNKHRKLVISLIALFRESQRAGKTAGDLRLADIAEKLQISKWQLIKVFKRYTGTTPMKYYEGLQQGKSVICEQDVPMAVTRKRKMKKEEQKQGSMGEIECNIGFSTEAEPSADFLAPLVGIINDDWISEFLDS